LIQILSSKFWRDAADIFLALLAREVRAFVGLLKEEEGGGKDG